MKIKRKGKFVVEKAATVRKIGRVEKAMWTKVSLPLKKCQVLGSIGNLHINVEITILRIKKVKSTHIYVYIQNMINV